MTAKYWVTTYEPELRHFTEQPGVPAGPYTQFGLRAPLRALRALGYPCDYSSKDGTGDPSVSVSTDPPLTLEQIAARNAEYARLQVLGQRRYKAWQKRLAKKKLDLFGQPL